MTAKEMFEKLGYKRYVYKNGNIRYLQKIFNLRYDHVIIFHPEEKTYTARTANKKTKLIESRYVIPISVNLNEAIQKQIEELGGDK